ncbi:glutamate 5-kinase [Candidatus Peregrinibacteria bacterium]|nr:glutamate 5-kinase [Candidatus Peregrinibacteria bacterium]
MKYKRIVIKVGTNVITQENGFLNEPVLTELVRQIAHLKKGGMEVVLVSSGAMGAGRPLVRLREKCNRVLERQILASVGQTRLMNTYDRLLQKHGFLCAQVLATKEDFRDRRHYLNMKSCLEGLLQDEILPIVNENDVISVSELMFTDNDELAGLLSAMLSVDALIILSTVDGVMDRDPKEKGAKVIPVVEPKQKNIHAGITSEKSLFGRGGMLTKYRIAERMSKIGITTHIVNGTLKNILPDILSKKPIGTVFLPAKKVSGMKKWIAHAEGQEKGVAIVNKCAEEVLIAKDKAASLLPVGIIKVTGDFEKGDIIRVENEKGERVALGVAQYNSRKAKEFIGKSGKKPLIHYDYLFIIN